MPVDNYQNADYKAADDRGRITLGQEYANSQIAVAWSKLPGTEEVGGVKPSEEQLDKLSELADWADENGYSPLDFDEYRGRIYTKDAEWVDTDVDGLSKTDEGSDSLTELHADE